MERQTARANLYYAQDDRRPRSILEAAGLQAVIDRGADTDPGTIALRVGDATVEVVEMAPSDRATHLDALHAFLTTECELVDPDLPTKIKAARAAITVTVDAGPGSADACARLVREIAARTGAIVLGEDGAFEDGEGRTLARPAQGAGEASEAADAGSAPAPGFAPPSRDAVARRTLALVAIAWRGQLDSDRSPEAAAQLAVWRGWVEAQGLLLDMEEGEKSLVQAKLGSLSQRQVTYSGWGVEGAAVLAWGLRLADLPPPDVTASPPLLAKVTGLFAAEPRAFAAELRPREELAAMTARLFGISWRLLRFRSAPGPFDFVAHWKATGLDLAGIPVVDGDLAVGGVPIARAERSAVVDATSIAVERYRAARWLDGRQATWSGQAPTRGA